MTEKYFVTMTNPLASGHDGSWDTDLLMECHPGTRAEPSLANGDSGSTSSSTRSISPQREDSGSVSTGGGGGGVVGESSSGGGASVTRPNESPPPATDTGDGNGSVSGDAGRMNRENRGGGLGGGSGLFEDGSEDDKREGESDEEAAASGSDEPLISDDDVELSDGGDESDPTEKDADRKDNTAQHQGTAEQEWMAGDGTEGEVNISSDVCLSEPEPVTEAGTSGQSIMYMTAPLAASLATTVPKTPRDSLRSADTFASPEKTLSTSPEASLRSAAAQNSATTVFGPLMGDFGSPGSLTSLGESADQDDVGSDSSFDENQEQSEASSEEYLDYDSYEVDVVFPPCSIMHKERKTFKYSLCEECYKKYKEDLERAGGSISDVDTSTGRRKRKKPSGRRRRSGRTEAPAGEKYAKEERPNRLQTATGETESLRRARKKRRETGAVPTSGSLHLKHDDSLRIEPRMVGTGGKVKVKGLSRAKVRLTKVGCDKRVIMEESVLDAAWSVKESKKIGVAGNVGGDKKGGGSGGSLWQPSGKAKREGEGFFKPLPKCEKRGGLAAGDSAAKTKIQASNAASATRAPHPSHKLRRGEIFGSVPWENSRAEASKALLLSPPIEKPRGRTASALKATPPQRPGFKRALSSDSGGVARAGRMLTANGGTARLRRESSLDSSIASAKAAAAAPRTASTAAPSPATIAPPRSITTAGSRRAATTTPRSATPAVDVVRSLVAGSLMPATSSTNLKTDAGTLTSGSRPAGSSRGYEKTCFPGVVRSLSNGKFFLWACDKLFDGKPYDGADACAREYTRLLNASRGNHSEPGKIPGDGGAVAPSRPGTLDLSALSFNASGVSLTAKKAPSSGLDKKTLAKPKKATFSLFGSKSSSDSSAQQSRALPGQTSLMAESSAEKCPNIDGRIVRRSPLPLLYFPSYSEGSTGTIRWSPNGPLGRPMDGLHVPCDPNAQPKRSGTKGGRKGRAVPDTRANCAQRGKSAQYCDPGASNTDTRGEADDALPQRSGASTAPGQSLSAGASKGGMSSFEIETPRAATATPLPSRGSRTTVTMESGSCPAAVDSNNGGVEASNSGGGTEGLEAVARADSLKTVDREGSKIVGTPEGSITVEKKASKTTGKKAPDSVEAKPCPAGTPSGTLHSCADSAGIAVGANQEGGGNGGCNGDVTESSARAKQRADANGRQDTGGSSRVDPNAPTATPRDHPVQMGKIATNPDQVRNDAIQYTDHIGGKAPENPFQMQNNATNISIQMWNNTAKPIQMRSYATNNPIQVLNSAIHDPVQVQTDADDNPVQLRKNSTTLVQIQSNTANDPVQMRNNAATNKVQSINNATIPVHTRRDVAENMVQMRNNAIDSAVQMKNSSANNVAQMPNIEGGYPIQVRNNTANGRVSMLDNVAKPPVQMLNNAANNPVQIQNIGDNNPFEVRNNRVNNPEGHARCPWRQTVEQKDEIREEEQGREILQSMLMAGRTVEESVDMVVSSDDKNGSCIQGSDSKSVAYRSSLFPDSMSRCNGTLRRAFTALVDEAREVNTNEMVLEESDVEGYTEDAHKAVKADIDKLMDAFKKRVAQALREEAPIRRGAVAVNARSSRASSPSASSKEFAASDAGDRATPTSIAYRIQSSQVPWQRPGKISRELDTARASNEYAAGLLTPWSPPRRLGKSAASNRPAEDRSASIDTTAVEEQDATLSSSSSACDDDEVQGNPRQCANETSAEDVQQVSWRTPNRLGSVRRGHTAVRQKSPNQQSDNEIGAQVPADVLRLPLQIAEVLGDEARGDLISQTSCVSSERRRVSWRQPGRLASPSQRSHVVTPSVSLSSSGLPIESHSQEEDAEEEIMQDASLRIGNVDGSPRETDDGTVDQFELLLQRSRLEYPAREEEEKEDVTAAAASAAAHTYRDTAPPKANEHARKQGDDAVRRKIEPREAMANEGDRAGDEPQKGGATDEHARNQREDSTQSKECKEAMANKDGRAYSNPQRDGAVDEHGPVDAAPSKVKGHAGKQEGNAAARSKKEYSEATANTGGLSGGNPQSNGPVGMQDSANAVPSRAKGRVGEKEGDNVPRRKEEDRKVAVKKGRRIDSIPPRDATVCGSGSTKKGKRGICSGGSSLALRRRDSSSSPSRAGSKSGSLDRSRSNSSFAPRRGRDDIGRPRNRERHSSSSSRCRRDDRFGPRSRESPDGKSFRRGGERGYECDDFDRKTRESSKGTRERRKRESSRRRASSSEDDRKSPHDKDRRDWSGRRRRARSRSPQRDYWRR